MATSIPSSQAAAETNDYRGREIETTPHGKTAIGDTIPGEQARIPATGTNTNPRAQPAKSEGNVIATSSSSVSGSPPSSSHAHKYTVLAPAPAAAPASAGGGQTAFMTSVVQKDHVDLVLLACAFCSGLIDSSMFVAYTTFVSMQTGNTIFLGLAISNQGPRPDVWIRPFLAILCFIVGAIFFSRLFLVLGPPRRRLTLVLNFAIQTILVYISASVTQSGAINSDVPATVADGLYALSHVPICLLAFQSAGQITASRSLEIGELPTVVITSLLCDLFSDPNLLILPPSKNVKRNRRVVGFSLTFTGAIIGGWMGKRLGNIGPSLLLAGSIKACLTLAWILWPIEKTKNKNAV